MNNIFTLIIILFCAAALISWLSDIIFPEHQQKLTERQPRSMFSRSFSEEEADHIAHLLGVYDVVHPLTITSAGNLGLKREIEAHINISGVQCYISIEDWDQMVRLWVSTNTLELGERQDLITLSLINNTTNV